MNVKGLLMKQKIVLVIFNDFEIIINKGEIMNDDLVKIIWLVKLLCIKKNKKSI